MQACENFTISKNSMDFLQISNDSFVAQNVVGYSIDTFLSKLQVFLLFQEKVSLSCTMEIRVVIFHLAVIFLFFL